MLVKLVSGFVLGCVVGTVLCSQPTPADTSRPNRVTVSVSNKLVIDRLASSLFRCPDRFWPGWKPASLGILLVDVPKENAVIVRGVTSSLDNEKRVTVAPVSYDSLPSHLKQKRVGHAVIPWVFNERMLAVHYASSNEAEIDRVIGLVLHEAFHLSGQSWRVDFGFARGLHFPDNARFRYLRRRIIDDLREAVRSEDFGGIAFWLNEIREKHGLDQKRLLQLDAVEGTAEYVLAIGSSIASQGCDENERVILEGAFARMDAKWRDQSAYSVTAFPDVEAYVIGAYSGLLLRRAGYPGWEKAVEKGQPMLHLLVQQVAAKARAEDPELDARIQQEVELRNDFIEPKLDALRASLRSSQHTVVSVPRARLGSLVPLYGYVTYEAESADDVLIALGARVQAYLDDFFGSLELRGKDVLLSNHTPCGSYRQAVFTVAKGSTTEIGGGVKIVDANVFAEIGTTIKRTDGKVPWLCVPP